MHTIDSYRSVASCSGRQCFCLATVLPLSLSEDGVSLSLSPHHLYSLLLLLLLLRYQLPASIQPQGCRDPAVCRLSRARARLSSSSTSSVIS